MEGQLQQYVLSKVIDSVMYMTLYSVIQVIYYIRYNVQYIHTQCIHL